MKLFIKSILFVLLSTFTLVILSGCSEKKPSVKILKKIERTGVENSGFCVKGNIETSNLIHLSKIAFGKDYEYDGGKCRDFILEIANRRCFHNMEEVYKYINGYTDYSMEINTRNIKGLEVNNLTIRKAIDYLNSRGSKKKIIYFDDNLPLKNKYGLYLKTIGDLKSYISETTPLYFQQIRNTQEKVVYVLRYKKIKKRLGDTNNIMTDIREAEALTCEDKNMNPDTKNNVLNKLEKVMRGVRNYDDSK